MRVTKALPLHAVRSHWLIAAYVLAIVAANMLIAAFGPWFSPINAFLFIGLDLVLRDKLHDRYQGSPLVMAPLVLGASAITYFVNPAAQHIAIASAVSFAASGTADWLAYSALRGRSFLARSNGSNVAGAAVDSLLFPTLAFGVLMPEIIALQFAAKVAGGAVWAFAITAASRKGAAA